MHAHGLRHLKSGQPVIDPTISPVDFSKCCPCVIFVLLISLSHPHSVVNYGANQGLQGEPFIVLPMVVV